MAPFQLGQNSYTIQQKYVVEVPTTQRETARPQVIKVYIGVRLGVDMTMMVGQRDVGLEMKVVMTGVMRWCCGDCCGWLKHELW